MNTKQRRVLIAAAILIAVAFIFPPTYLEIGTREYLFYMLVFDSSPRRIDVLLLFAEWVGICLIAGIAWLLCGDDNRARRKD